MAILYPSANTANQSATQEGMPRFQWEIGLFNKPSTFKLYSYRKCDSIFFSLQTESIIKLLLGGE